MALSAGLMLGLQIGTIKRQFAKEQENLQNSVKKAVEESSNIFSIWNSHTSNAQNQKSYNSIYHSSDSTFTVFLPFHNQNNKA
jgi:hypothetical protein